MRSWRRIHGGIFDDAWIVNLSADAKLLFIWAFTTADDGIADCAHAVVAAKLGMTPARVQAAIDECAPKLVEVQGRIVVDGWVRYQVSNASYAQAVAHAASRHPPAVQAAWAAANGAFYTLMGWSGLEYVDAAGDEPIDPAVAAEADADRDSARARAAVALRAERADIAVIFDYWREKCRHPASTLSPDREAKIRARLREGMDLAQAKLAIDGCVARGPIDGRMYDSIDLIFRNAGKVDQFVSLAQGNGASPAAPPPPRSYSVLFPEINPDAAPKATP